MTIRNHTPRARPVRVLIGNSDELMSDCISSVIHHAFGNQFEVCSIQIGSPYRLIDWAKKQQYDLFIVVLNNLVVGGPEERLKVSLAVVSHLKNEYQKPVIAITGHPADDPLFVAETIRAGADAFFPLPFDVAEFVRVIKTLLTPESAS